MTTPASIADYTIGQYFKNTILPTGTLVEVSARVFVITGIMSGVNYTATEVSTGRKYKLRRTSSFKFAGYDESHLEKVAEAKVGMEQGAVVKFKTGKHTGKVGVVYNISGNGNRANVAVPGERSMVVDITSLEVVNKEELILF